MRQAGHRWLSYRLGVVLLLSCAMTGTGHVDTQTHHRQQSKHQAAGSVFGRSAEAVGEAAAPAVAVKGYSIIIPYEKGKNPKPYTLNPNP